MAVRVVRGRCAAASPLLTLRTVTVSIERGVVARAPGRIGALVARAAAIAVLASRRALLAAADAVVPPQLALFEQVVGIARTELLGTAARLGLADRLAAGPLPVHELARRAGVDAPTLSRALRALAAGGVFRFRPDGRVENSRLSAAFRSDAPASMRDFLDYFGSRANVAAWTELEETLRTGESAFRRVHGQKVWDWFSRHRDDGKIFSAALARLTELDAASIADARPLKRLRTLCDVAGGEGTILATILAQTPALRGVLFDRPEIIRRARLRTSRLGLDGRLAYVAGDFFRRVPGGCDGYLLKDVLHDWDDDAALRLLRNCQRASTTGAQLLVIEMLLGPREARSPACFADLQMLTVTQGGRQRSRDELAELLWAGGWAVREVLALPGPLSMAVAIRRPTPGGHPRRRRGAAGHGRDAGGSAAARPRRRPRGRPRG